MPPLSAAGLCPAVWLLLGVVPCPALGEELHLGPRDGPRVRIEEGTGETWLSPGGRPSGWQPVVWGGIQLDSRELRVGEDLLVARVDRPSPLEAQITFSCPEPRLDLGIQLEIDDAGWKIRTWILNLAREPLPLRSIRVLDMNSGATDIPPDWRMLVDSGRYASGGVQELDEPRRSSMATLLYSPGQAQAILVGFLSNRAADNWIRAKPAPPGEATIAVDVLAEDPGILAPGDTWISDPVRLSVGTDPLELLEDYGDEVRRTVQPPLPPHPLAGFLTWYGYGTGVTEEQVLEAGRSTARLLAGYEQDHEPVVLLDHGWTRDSRLGDWQTPDSPGFPHGMAWLSARLAECGVTLGLWYTPFFVTEDAEEYGELEALYCRGMGDRPVTVNAAIWPDGSRPMQLLDSSLEKARLRNRDDLSVMNGWGIGLWKLDFFTVHSSLQRNRSWPAWRLNAEVWASLSAGIDEGDLILPCTSFTNRHLGYCGLMNIPADVGVAGDWPASLPAFREVLTAVSASWYKHGNFWTNDHQSVQLGGTSGEARVRATMNTHSGAGFWWGDDPAALPPDRLAMLQRCLPVYGHSARPVSLFTAPGSGIAPVVWSLAVDSDWAGNLRTVAIFNLSEEPRSTRVEPAWFGADPEDPLAVMEWWQGAYLAAELAPLEVEIPPMDALVLHAAPLQEHPWIVSTDLHYAPTWILEGVRWEAEDGALVGEVVTRAGLRGHIYGTAPEGLAPTEGIVRDRVADGFRAWSVEVETSGPRTPFRIEFRAEAEPR